MNTSKPKAREAGLPSNGFPGHRSSEFDVLSEERIGSAKKAQRAAEFKKLKISYDEIEDAMQVISQLPPLSLSHSTVFWR
jgi:hypothetical protein